MELACLLACTEKYCPTSLVDWGARKLLALSAPPQGGLTSLRAARCFRF